jgi:hypothetical protein
MVDVPGLIRGDRKQTVRRTMAKDTITLALNGDSIILENFAEAITKFQSLVAGLSHEVLPDKKVRWFVVNLESGSAMATIQGCIEDEEVDSAEKVEDTDGVEKIVDAYLNVGQSLQEGTPFPYSTGLYKTAQSLVSMINGNITSMRFETPDDDVEILHRKTEEKAATPSRPSKSQVVLGSMRGRVQSLSNRGALRFTLYDLIDDKAISCYFSPDYEGVMRDAWGKIAIVEGRIHRDPETGRATTIRDVRQVQILPESKPGEWREALRAAPGFLGDDLPEDVIRRSRDD